MAGKVLERDERREKEPITAAANEQDRLIQIEDLLSKAYPTPDAQYHPTLLGPNREMIELPESISLLLRQVVSHLRQGHALTLVPLHPELTTQEAADILNVSRPFLIRLLERGEIPYLKTGKHRRVRFDDLMIYKNQRDATRREALDRLTELAQEYGLDRYQD